MAAQPTPIEPPGRGLLDGKRVVITAAAGTGIGGAGEHAGGLDDDGVGVTERGVPGGF